MPINFDSIAEGNAASTMRQLGGKYHPDFTPLLSRHYLDASDTELEGKPDYLIRRKRCFTFVDTKAGKLNNHHTRESSRKALAENYEYYLQRPADDMSHSALSDALYHSRIKQALLAALEHGFNHSLWKLVALQAKHGWQRFLVVFEKNPSKADAARYAGAGLVFCTIKTLPDMLNTIELLAHGWEIPLVLKTRTYAYTVTPEHGSNALHFDAVEAIDRSRFLAAVAADKEAEAARNAADAADLAAGNLPF